MKKTGAFGLIVSLCLVCAVGCGVTNQGSTQGGPEGVGVAQGAQEALCPPRYWDVDCSYHSTQADCQGQIGIGWTGEVQASQPDGNMYACVWNSGSCSRGPQVTCAMICDGPEPEAPGLYADCQDANSAGAGCSGWIEDFNGVNWQCVPSSDGSYCYNAFSCY
jgi:hypothetical protein